MPDVMLIIEKAAKFLDHAGWLVEDWLPAEPWPDVDRKWAFHEAKLRRVRTDLTKYVSSVQGVVLSPLPGVVGWQEILGHALKSAHERLVITVPLPFSDPYGTRVVDGGMQFNRRELLVWFEAWEVVTEEVEGMTMFFLSKR